MSDDPHKRQTVELAHGTFTVSQAEIAFIAFLAVGLTRQEAAEEAGFTVHPTNVLRRKEVRRLAEAGHAVLGYVLE